jgi:hypothetical protein
MGDGNQYRVIIRQIIEQEAVAMVVGWSGAYQHDDVWRRLPILWCRQGLEAICIRQLNRGSRSSSALRSPFLIRSARYLTAA